MRNLTIRIPMHGILGGRPCIGISEDVNYKFIILPSSYWANNGGHKHFLNKILHKSHMLVILKTDK